jgi:hypothetical protein
LNCCDYDALNNYPTGSFSSKYKSKIFGSLVEIEKDDSFSENTVKTFFNAEYKTYKTTKEIILYRLFGSFKNDIADKNEKPRGAKINGIYASTEFAESIIDAKIRLALDPEWKNPRVYEVKILVPAGTKISVGRVAPVALKTKTVLEGLAEQILLPKDWSTDWIVGYRRVTSRQLVKLPEYKSIKSQEELNKISCVNKTILYNKICPICECEEIEVLSPEKQFEIVGCKGSVFLMKYHCLNDNCQYYW